MELKNQSKLILKVASILMVLSISLGAFGAHALKDILSDKFLTIYHTGVEYQFYNTLGLFVIGILVNFVTNVKRTLISFYFVFIGTIIFSGSLYILTIFNIPILGAITPIGGTMQIIGWLILFTVFKRN